MGCPGQGDVAVPAGVAADLVAVQAVLLLRALEAFLDSPAAAGDVDQLIERGVRVAVGDVVGVSSGRLTPRRAITQWWRSSSVSSPCRAHPLPGRAADARARGPITFGGSEAYSSRRSGMACAGCMGVPSAGAFGVVQQGGDVLRQRLRGRLGKVIASHNAYLRNTKRGRRGPRKVIRLPDHRSKQGCLRPYFPADFPLVAIDLSCCLVSTGVYRVAAAFRDLELNADTTTREAARADGVGVPHHHARTALPARALTRDDPRAVRQLLRPAPNRSPSTSDMFGCTLICAKLASLPSSTTTYAHPSSPRSEATSRTRVAAA